MELHPKTPNEHVFNLFYFSLIIIFLYIFTFFMISLSFLKMGNITYYITKYYNKK